MVDIAELATMGIGVVEIDREGFVEVIEPDPSSSLVSMRLLCCQNAELWNERAKVH